MTLEEITASLDSGKLMIYHRIDLDHYHKQFIYRCLFIKLWALTVTDRRKVRSLKIYVNKIYDIYKKRFGKYQAAAMKEMILKSYEENYNGSSFEWWNDSIVKENNKLPIPNAAVAEYNFADTFLSEIENGGDK